MTAQFFILVWTLRGHRPRLQLAATTAESRINCAVEDGAKAIVDPEVQKIAVAGGALLEAQQDFFGRGVGLSKSDLVADLVVLGVDVERKPLEEPNVCVAIQRNPITIHVIQVLRNVGGSAKRSPRRSNADRRVERVTGNSLLKLVEDRYLPILVRRRPDGVLNRQAAPRRFAVGKEVILDGRGRGDRPVDVGETGMAYR